MSRGNRSRPSDTALPVKSSSSRASERPLDSKEPGASNLVALAHELKTPITAVRASLELLADTPPQDQDATQLIGRALRGICWIENIIDNISLFALTEAGLLDRQVHRLSVLEHAQLAVHLVRPLLERKHQTIRVEDRAGDPAVVADPRLLVQMIVNLVVNASVHGPANNTIRLIISRTCAGLEVRVVDRGAGIPESELERIFGQFARAAGAAPTPSHALGAGLGLYLVSTFADWHGGTVGAESGHEQTSFWFTLPLPDAGQDQVLEIHVDGYGQA